MAKVYFNSRDTYDVFVKDSFDIVAALKLYNKNDYDQEYSVHDNIIECLTKNDAFADIDVIEKTIDIYIVKTRISSYKDRFLKIIITDLKNKGKTTEHIIQFGKIINGNCVDKTLIRNIYPKVLEVKSDIEGILDYSNVRTYFSKDNNVLMYHDTMQFERDFSKLTEIKYKLRKAADYVEKFQEQLTCGYE